MPYLVITGGDGERRTVEIEEPGPCTIGRSSRNGVVLPDLALSRQHAEVFTEGGLWHVRDSGSRNGTFLNGRPVEGKSPLNHGDRIGLGGTTLEFQIEKDSSTRVTFSDQPLAAEGTVFLAVNEVMTSPLAPGGADISQDGAMQARLRKLQVIEKANLELLGHEAMDVLLPKVLDLAASAVKSDRAALFLLEDGELQCRAFRGSGTAAEMSISRTIAKTVMEQHVAVLTSDAQSDARFREGASIMAQGIHAVMAVPLWNNREVIGLIYADSRLSTGLFQDDDLRVLTMLGNIAAIQIENARLFEQQLEKQRFEQEARAAAEIQRRLLPGRTPELAGYAMEGLNLPCHEVGGDYFDYIPLAGGSLAVLLADVAGKGMGAAMLMAGLQATCHARLEIQSDPLDLMAHLNAAISRMAPSNRFVTLFMMSVDPETHTLQFVNAGHAPEPLLVRVGGATERLKAGGVPLGILPKVNYPVGTAELQLGDMVFLCSDGVTETVDGDGNEYGEEKLEALLAGLAGSSPAEVRQAVEDSLEEHAQGEPQPDDLTMVIVQRTP